MELDISFFNYLQKHEAINLQLYASLITTPNEPFYIVLLSCLHPALVFSLHENPRLSAMHFYLAGFSVSFNLDLQFISLVISQILSDINNEWQSVWWRREAGPLWMSVMCPSWLHRHKTAISVTICLPPSTTIRKISFIREESEATAIKLCFQTQEKSC